MKTFGIVALVLAALAGWGALRGGGTTSISLVRSRSFCATDSYNAKLYVHVTLRNSGNTAKISVRPWRRYSDGTENDSAMDTFNPSVPSHETRPFYASYDYNAEVHELLECGVYLGGSPTITPLSVKST